MYLCIPPYILCILPYIFVNPILRIFTLFSVYFGTLCTPYTEIMFSCACQTTDSTEGPQVQTGPQTLPWLSYFRLIHLLLLSHTPHHIHWHIACVNYSACVMMHFCKLYELIRINVFLLLLLLKGQLKRNYANYSALHSN
jgi:hypothetical protein